MNDLFQICINEVSQVFGANEDWYEKYLQDEIIKSPELAFLIKQRENFGGTGDWKAWTPLGGPGTLLNGCVLYCIIRHYNLKSALETGVSGGYYSSFMLAALKKNKGERLTSIELETGEEVGKLIPQLYRDIWTLYDGVNSLSFLKEHKQNYPLYSHDSLHTLKHMTNELLYFKKCSLDEFFVFIDDQNSEMFWEKAKQLRLLHKKGYKSSYVSGNESAVKGHLGGFIRFAKE